MKMFFVFFVISAQVETQKQVEEVEIVPTKSKKKKK
jgi:hypothetical protein